MKQEGDPEGWWEETFKSFSDSKPKGPEAISFDLSFPGAQHVYGLPERATSLSLQPTTGAHPIQSLKQSVHSEPGCPCSMSLRPITDAAHHRCNAQFSGVHL